MRKFQARTRHQKGGRTASVGAENCPRTSRGEGAKSPFKIPKVGTWGGEKKRNGRHLQSAGHRGYAKQLEKKGDLRGKNTKVAPQIVPIHGRATREVRMHAKQQKRERNT